MGCLRSGLGRMEMPCLGRDPWAPFQAFLPNLTKVSGQPHTSHLPCGWLVGLSRAAPCSHHLLLMAPALLAHRHSQEEMPAHHQ